MALSAESPCSTALRICSTCALLSCRRVALMRRWTSGGRGLYSADGPVGPLAGMHRVEDGDFFGTVIPLLQEGARIARAHSPAGGAA